MGTTVTHPFTKNTHQTVANSKQGILDDADPDKLGDKDLRVSNQNLESCLTLNEHYQEQHRMNADTLRTLLKGKQLGFSETVIFDLLALCSRHGAERTPCAPRTTSPARP